MVEMQDEPQRVHLRGWLKETALGSKVGVYPHEDSTYFIFTSAEGEVTRIRLSDAAVETLETLLEKRKERLRQRAFQAWICTVALPVVEAIHRQVCPEAFDETGNMMRDPLTLGRVVTAMHKRGLNAWTGLPIKASAGAAAAEGGVMEDTKSPRILAWRVWPKGWRLAVGDAHTVLAATREEARARSLRAAHDAGYRTLRYTDMKAVRHPKQDPAP